MRVCCYAFARSIAVVGYTIRHIIGRRPTSRLCVYILLESLYTQTVYPSPCLVDFTRATLSSSILFFPAGEYIYSLILF